MAFSTGDQSLQIIIKAKDEASKQLDAVNKKVTSLKPAFKTMALAGGAAFTALAAGAGAAVKEAANAEGAFAKFNTVFADGSDDMQEFIDNLRKEMPLATHEIVRMSADLQDLLVPMGLTRDSAQDMTKGFLDLSNKLAAFNDVDPTEVLEAFKSGLSGSSEPLRRFGINALDSTIELEAMETGLLDVGQKLSDLDPITRNQVKAQALLTLATKQSSDAVNGFAANNDSLLRRTQNLNATLTEMKASIGAALIPVVDDLVKKITPVIEKIVDWIEANPDLVKAITIATIAIAGLVAILGVVGIAFAAINIPVLIISGVIIALVAGITALILKWDELNAMMGEWGAHLISQWEGATETVSNSWHVIKGTFEQWGMRMQLFKNDITQFWAATKEAFKEGANFLVQMAENAANSWIGAINSIIGALNKIQIRIPSVAGFGGFSFGINIPKVDEISLPRFEHGGIVPGPAGVPVPIIAHGQERILPQSNSRGGNSGGNITINIFNPVMSSRTDVTMVKEQLDKVVRGLVRDNKLTTV